MQGYLFRKSGILKIWKRQYYVIDKNYLIEYSNEQKETQLGQFEITSRPQSTTDSSKEFCFKIQLGSKHIVFSAENEEQYQNWERAFQQSLESASQQSKPSTGNEKNRSVSLNDFEIIKVIGRGTFGKVSLVKYKGDGKLYAMKAMSKKKLADERNVNNVLVEKEVLIRTKHPFLVHAYFCFQTETKIFIILDYIPGGELFSRLREEGRFSEQRAQLYAAEILLGLEKLHNDGFIYRDLKPENILVDIDGHLKITDFGFAKGNISSSSTTTNSFCGTPEYLAPEVFKQQPYTRSVDWWSFGALTYEMLTGDPPFYDTNPKKMYMAILFNPLPLPKYLSKVACDLCRQLLDKDPTKRLGAGPTDAQEIKNHPFFKGIDWDKVLRKEVRSSYIPPVEDPTDTSQFDPQFTAETPGVSYEDPDMVPMDVQDAFINFTCNNEDDSVIGHS